jgi:mRNA interferase MazF
VIVVPLTLTDRKIPIHLAIERTEGGLTSRSFALCDAVRSISTDQLVGGPRGRVHPATMRAIEETLLLLMDL